MIINQVTGKVDHRRCFDTYSTSEHFEKFIEETEIPFGRIIVAALKDDGSKWMSEKIKDFFKDLGSMEIMRLGY